MRLACCSHSERFTRVTKQSIDNSAAHRTDRRERPDDLRVQTAESVSMRTTANKGTLTLPELTGLGANRNSRGGAPQLVQLLCHLLGFTPLVGCSLFGSRKSAHTLASACASCAREGQRRMHGQRWVQNAGRCREAQRTVQSCNHTLIRGSRAPRPYRRAACTQTCTQCTSAAATPTRA